MKAEAAGQLSDSDDDMHAASLDKPGDKVKRWGGKPVFGAELLKRYREESANEYETATKVLGDRELQLHARMVYHVGGPVLKVHLDTIKKLKSQTAVVQHAASRAAGHHIDLMRKVVVVIQNPYIASRCGLDGNANAPVTFAHPGVNTNHFWKLCWAVVARIAWNGEYQTHMLPLKFAQLLHKEWNA